MTDVSYIKLWETESDDIVFEKDEVQDMNINHLNLEVYDIYKEDKKLTNVFEAVNDEDVINKAFLDEKLSKTDGRLSFLGRDYNDFKLHYNKQSVEEILIQSAVKTTIQAL